MKRSAPYTRRTPISKRRRGPPPTMPAVRAEIKKQIAIRTDYKTADNISASVVTTRGGTVDNLLGLLAQGTTGINDYIGDRVFPKYLQVNYSVYNTDTLNFHSVRVIIGQTLTQSLPSPADLITNHSSENACVSLNNVTVSGNHKILHDRTYMLSAQAGGPSAYNHRCFIPGKRMVPVHFSSLASGTETRNALFIAYFTSAATSAPFIRYCSRFKFSD